MNYQFSKKGLQGRFRKAAVSGQDDRKGLGYGVLEPTGRFKPRKSSSYYPYLDPDPYHYLDNEEEIAFDHHGKEIKMPYKMSSKLIESYPRRTLEKTKNNVKKPEITYDAAIAKLTSKLKKSVSIGKRNLEEKIIIDEIIELYVPIYEARLIGPKKSIRLMRIDAVSYTHLTLPTKA